MEVRRLLIQAYMRSALNRFLRDERGAGMPEYAVLLFAVLLAGSAGARHLGPKVLSGGDVTRRILSGENVTVPASIGGGVAGVSGATSGSLNPSGDSAGSSGTAGNGGSSSGGSLGAGGGNGGGAAGGGGSTIGGSGSGSSSGSGGIAVGGGVVVGASGSDSFGGVAGNAGGLGSETTNASGIGENVGSAVGGPSLGSSETADSFNGGSGGGAGSSGSGGSSGGGFMGGGGSRGGSSISGSASTASRSGSSSSSGGLLSNLYDFLFGSSSSSEDENTVTGVPSSAGDELPSAGKAQAPKTSGAIARAVSPSKTELSLPGTRSSSSRSTSTSRSSATGVIGASNAPRNNVNPPPGDSGGVQGRGYTISAAGERQMQALLAQARANAGGKRPKGKCYHVVKTDIDEVGYGDIARTGNTAFPRQIPSSKQEYAHQFADYMNARAANGRTNADNLGLQRLPITNPYDAPPGSIIVVRAGTPGTRNPIAGDIVVAGGNGKFYNDGNMGYGGSRNFPPGNNYVLGIYAPK